MSAERYAYEKFMVAVDGMATSTKDLQSRLGDAFVGSLIRLQPEDFGDHEDKEAFESIVRELTKIKAEGSEGNVAATVRRMSDEEAVAVARKIVNLQHSLRRKDDLE
jgi:hypothetical protein